MIRAYKVVHGLCSVVLLAVTSACSAPDFVEQDVDPAGAPSVLPQVRPNILMIVADDLGYSELGSYGGEIRTPKLDALAQRGLVFTDFNTSPACAPTRAMLLSGVDNHPAGLGAFGEVINGGLPATAPPLIRQLLQLQLGREGYEGYLHPRVSSFPALLQDAGYRTYMAGKWHVGFNPGQWPVDRGFDQSFALLDGGASHFADARALLDPAGRAQYVENGQRVATLPDDFYSTSYFVDKTIQWIDDGFADDSERPFFSYVAFTAPHDPLQVPEADLELYRGHYDEGYDVIKKRRFERMQRLGVVADQVVPAQKPAQLSSWAELSEKARLHSARSMEIYAAMVELLDRESGRLLDHLADIGVLENTVVIFLSDNGAAVTNPRFYGWGESDFDNSLQNMGRPGSFVSYGVGWAHAGMVPFKLFKGTTAEGGLRTPLIVAGPGVDQRGLNHELVHVTDVTTTVLDLARVNPPDSSIAMPMTGRSLVPILDGSSASVRKDQDYFGWELTNARGLRQGNWKYYYTTSMFTPEDARWELYNVHTDPAEGVDLSGDFPDRYQHMHKLWNQYVDENKVILLEQ